MTEWPMTSSPTLPPKAVLYYARQIAGVHQGVHAEVFAEVWQAGVYLNRIFAADVQNVNFPVDRYSMTYELVTERNGDLISGFQTFWVKLHCVDIDTAMREGAKHTKSRIPWNAEKVLRRLTGKAQRSYGAYIADVEPSRSSDDAEGVQANNDESSLPAKRRRPDAASRTPKPDGLITLASLCEGTTLEPSDVRAALRKKGVEKPAHGWSFEAGDSRINVIKDIINKGAK